MVGEAGGPGGAPAGVTAGGMSADVRSAYDTAAQRWADGAVPVYAALARALVAAADPPPAGARVLDLGAGTGTAGRAALAAGARWVVSADLAVGMLRRAGPDAHPVAAEATALPFRDGSFDLVLAAFCLGHLTDPAAALREARRVGGALAASSFAPDWTHPAKAAVDDTLASFGYRPPGWYLEFKRDTEPRASDPAELARLTAAAGFTGDRVREITVDTGVCDPAQLVAWRLGMAHTAPFVNALSQVRRAELRRAAEAAVAGSGPLVVGMLVLTAR